MIICICARVSDNTIEQWARSGQSFDDVQLKLGVGMQCGQCDNYARDIWARCNSCGVVSQVCEAGQTVEA
jgi:bacterioferritin-associated ferredoxin